MIDTIKSPEEWQRDLGAAVRSLRISRGLTQAEVAAKAGVAQRSIAVLERSGKSSVETFVRALSALQAGDLLAALAPRPQVSPLALLRREGEGPRRVRHRRQAA